MRTKHVKFEYDAEVDAAYLRLRRGRVMESEEVQPGVIFDFGVNDQVLGVEILRFTRRFRPRGTAAAMTRSRRKAPVHAR